MPRPITSYPADIVGLKRAETDVIHDYMYICAYLMEYLGNEFSEPYKEKINSKVRRCLLEKQPLVHKNRVYVTTDIRLISLMMVDVDEGILEHLKFTFDIIEADPEDIAEQKLEYLHAGLWIFEGDSMTYHAVLRPHTLAEMMVIFDKENLVDFNNARHDWKTKPRLNQRRNKDTSDLEEDA